MAIQDRVSPNTAIPKRKGFTARLPDGRLGVATEFTCIAPIIPGHEQAVSEAIAKYYNSPQAPEAVKQAGSLHESRWVLLGDAKYLMFASSFDGSWDDYIDDFFVTFIREIFDGVWSHCEGYPGSSDPTVRDWFMQHAIQALAYTSAYPGATTRDIWKALAVQQAFQQVLDNPASEGALQDPAMKPLLDLAAG